jgi:hypothetical protein
MYSRRIKGCDLSILLRLNSSVAIATESSCAPDFTCLSNWEAGKRSNSLNLMAGIRSRECARQVPDEVADRGLSRRLPGNTARPQ